MRSPSEGTPAAVVIGLDCVTGLQTARILARRKVPVVGLAKDPTHFCCRTRLVARVVRADTSSDMMIDALEALAAELDEPAVLFPCTDESVRILARHAERLRPLFHLVLPPAEVIDQLQDKLQFHRHAAALGLPVPRTIELSSRADAERAARELRFPAVLKPATRDRAWEREAGAKVLRVAGGGELLILFDRHHGARPLLVQEWIDGKDSDLYSFNGYFDAGSMPVATFIARKLRQWPPEAGVSCLGEECRNDELLNVAIRLFQSVGFRGLGYVEMKRDPRTRKQYLIEANVGRPTGRSAIAEAGGVEILYTMYLDATGASLPGPTELVQRYTGVKWVFWRNDLRSAFHYWRAGELSLREWAMSLRGIRTDAVLAWDDPSPFLADVSSLLRSAVRARLRAAPTPSVRLPAGAGSPLPDSHEPSPAGSGEVAEFDVHGIVGIRLVDAAPADIAAVAETLGILPGVLRNEPDLVLRYSQRIPTGDLTYVEVNRSAFDSEGFYLLDGPGGAPAVRLPLDLVGGPCEIVCRSGLRRVPLLRPLIRLTALWKGHLPFHASAFEWNGTGVVVTGWTHGGKTSAVLAFAEHGAKYVGDDLVLLSPDGRRMYGLAAPLGMSAAQARQSARLAAAAGRRHRMLSRGVRGLVRVAGSANGGPGRVGWIASRIERRMRVHLPPEAVFPAGIQLVSEPKKLFLMASGTAREIRVEPVAPPEVAARMIHSLDAEDRSLLDQYSAFRFAFPGSANERIEGASARRSRLVESALAGMDAYVVHHPYPAPLEELFGAMRPFCAATPLARATAPEPILAR